MNSDRNDQVVDGETKTPIQEGMLFHWVSDPNSGVNIEQIVGTLHEKLDAAKFRAAWTHVVARHAVFRTKFQWEKLQEPLQDVCASVDLSFEEQDWSMRSMAEKRLQDGVFSPDRIAPLASTFPRHTAQA